MPADSKPAPPAPLRLRFDEAEFRTLVAGGIVDLTAPDGQRVPGHPRRYRLDPDVDRAR